MNHFHLIQQSFGDLDGVLLTCAENRFYATGFASHGTDGVCLVTKQGAYYFTDFRYIEAASNQIGDVALAMCTRETPYTSLIQEIIDRENIQVLGVDYGYITVSSLENYRESLSCQLVDATSLLSELRQVKSPWEVEQIVSAQRIAERALEELYNDIRAGVQENFLAARLEYLMKIYGGEKPSFDTIAVSGAKSALPHGVPGTKLLESGDFLTLDFGCIYNGYCSDMTRTVAIGHATEEMEVVYNTVAKAQLAGIAMAKAGVTGKDVHQAAAQVIDAAGYGEYFGHGFGHGIGVEIHEAPNASPGNQKPLPSGAVISAEPGIYLPGKFGVRIEDMLLLTESGNENLTKAPKQLRIF